MKNIRATVQGRIARVALLMFVVLVVLTFRYAYLQVIQGDALAQRMRDQSGYEFRIQTLRGPILDRNGKELAVSSMTKSLFIDPNHVYDAHDPAEIAADIAPVLGLTEREVLDDIAVGGGFVWVKRWLEHDEYEAVRTVIREKGYSDCLGFQNEAKRYYPNDALAANVIGFVSLEDKGLGGVEHALDPLLKGEVREERLTVDGQRRPILDSIFFGRRTYGGDYCKTAVLTIDSTIQFMVEQELDRAMAENMPSSVTAIVMNPKTGEILAMASRPSYNPNRFWEYTDEQRKNRAVSFNYEPGSTFKAIVAGAALQEGIVTPNQVFYDPGYVIVSDRRIQNWNNESYGAVTFVDIVKNSLNTGFAQVGLSLGAEKLMHYTRLFGFGERTGIDLPGEAKGVLPSPEWKREAMRRYKDRRMQVWVPGDTVNVGIGQGFNNYTMLQMAQAVATLAADGVKHPPHLLKATQASPASEPVPAPRPAAQNMGYKSAHMNVVRQGMVGVTLRGTGRSAFKDAPYLSGGKTGTAQAITIGQKSRYNAARLAEYQRDHSLYIAFAPAEQPRIVVAAIVENAGIYPSEQDIKAVQRSRASAPIGAPRTVEEMAIRPPEAARPQTAPGPADAADAPNAVNAAIQTDSPPTPQTPEASAAPDTLPHPRPTAVQAPKQPAPPAARSAEDGVP